VSRSVCFPTTPTPDFSPLSLHDALPICLQRRDRDILIRSTDRAAEDSGRRRRERTPQALEGRGELPRPSPRDRIVERNHEPGLRSEEHTSELQSLTNLVCRLLLEQKNNN